MGQLPWPPHMRSALPAPLDHYQLVRRLGGGGGGEVYLAEHDGNPLSRWAIKFLHPNLTRPGSPHAADNLAAFLAEAELGRNVRSEYIGHTRDVFDLRGLEDWGWPRAAFVMPHYPFSLERVIGSGVKFPAGQIILWVRHLALSLAHLHEDRHTPCVHRDLKPANVMFRLAPDRSPDDVVRALTGATCVLTDLGTVVALNRSSNSIVCRDNAGEVDPFKDPIFYPLEAEGPFERPQVCRREMDLYAFGEALKAFVQLSETPIPGLLETTALCQGDPANRPRAGDLPDRLAADWRVQFEAIRRFGGEWRPSAHQGFVGRQYVRDAFDQFVSRSEDRGGVFVIEGPPGVGKSALLTNWAELTGRPLGYYFRYGGAHSAPDAMPRALAEQIKARYRFDDQIPTDPNQLRGFLEGLCQRVANLPGRDRSDRLILFVDALDEATDPSREREVDGPLKAAEFIPRDLPPGVFVVASSRPAAQEPGRQDHIAALRRDGAEIFPMNPDDEKNQNDVRRFLDRELRGESTDLQELLGARCGWLFLLVKLLVEAVHPSTRSGARPMPLSEALDGTRGWDRLDPSRRLFEYYRSSWQRLCVRQNPEHLGHLAALMVAAQGAIENVLIGEILEWHERNILKRHYNPFWSQAQVQSLLPTLSWFLARMDDALDADDGPKNRAEGPSLYQIRHRSVRDYLTSREGVVTPAAVTKMHQAIGQYFLDQAEANRSWQQVNPYGRFYAVRHLLSTNAREWVEHGCRLLCTPDFLQATLGTEAADWMDRGETR
jgi:hypothetical protein